MFDKVVRARFGWARQNPKVKTIGVAHRGDIETKAQHQWACRMDRRQANRSCLLFGSNPDRARSAYHGKRIVSDQLGRAFQFELDRVIEIYQKGRDRTPIRVSLS